MIAIGTLVMCSPLKKRHCRCARTWQFGHVLIQLMEIGNLYDGAVFMALFVPTYLYRIEVTYF